MEGRLKQKLLGDDGVLYWKSRAFVLRSRAQAFEITDEQSSGYDGASLPVASGDGRSRCRDDGCGRACVNYVSLQGARCAVAWTGIDAFNGCGFDLVWAGGRTWSLLCEDPLSRKSWVDAINTSIASSDDKLENCGQISTDADGHQRPYDASPALAKTGPRDDFSCSSRPPVGAGAPAPSSPQPGPGNGCDDYRRRSSRGADRVELTAANHSGRAEKAAVGRASAREEGGPPSDALSHCSRRLSPGDPPQGGVAGGTSPDVRPPPHQQQRRRPQGGPRRRRRRREEAAADVERLERSCCSTSDQGSGSDLDLMSGSSKRAVGEREGSSRLDGASSAEGGAPSGSGGRKVGSTRERSEELARASAATWEQFQELLERSRESKARFDRAMGEASVSASSGGASATAASELPPPSRRRDHARSDLPRKAPGGAGVARRGPRMEPPSANSGDVGSRFTPVVEAPAATSSDPSSQKGSHLDGSLGGSATDRVSDVTTPRSLGPRGTPGGTGVSGGAERGRGAARGGGEGGGGRAAAVRARSTSGQENLPARCEASARLSHDGRWKTSSEIEIEVAALAGSGVGGADPTADHERSRLSAGVTDVETSLLPEEGSAYASTGEEDHGGRYSEAGGCSTALEVGDLSCELGRGGRQNMQQGRRRPRASSSSPRSSPSSSSASSSKPPAPPPRRLRAATASVVKVTAEGSKIDAFTAACAQNQQRQQKQQYQVFGVDGHSTRRENSVQTESSAEDQRLREELAALEGAVVVEREREAERSRAHVGRDSGEAAAAAAEAREAAAAASAAASQRASDSRLGEALAEAEKAGRGRLEAVRQREELEKALAAEIRERQRVSELLTVCSRSETALRKRVDATVAEGDLKAKLASARSQLDAVSLERNALAEELDQCISRLGGQAREVASALRSRQQREIAEISSRCEIEKDAWRERVTLEAEEKAREDRRMALADQERRIRGELAAKASQEARQRDKQMRVVKAEAKAAGEATRKDIDKLRALHARRVKRLEALLKEEGDNLADARREIAACKATLAGDAGEFHRWTEEQRDQSSRLLKELAVIQKKVDRAVKMEADAREREGLAVNRLRKVMEEARLERAEAAEVKRQLREVLAELEADRNTQARRARTNLQLQRAAEIAQQEVAMVEAERKRWHEERRSMEAALERLTRLVYGTSGAIAANTTDKTSDNYPISKSSAGKSAAVHPWKPPGGVVAVGGRGQSNGARAPCSPIGVNAFRPGDFRDVGVGARGTFSGGHRGRR